MKMYSHYSKIALVWSVALYMTLVAFNNIADYGTNYAYVANVLKMDTTFKTAMWRSVDSVPLHHLAYWIIIAVETASGALCWTGGWRLLKASRSGRDFNRAKKTAVFGLVLAVALWFAGFITIGGEWFLMWQSEVWNAQAVSFRLTTITMLILVYVSMRDDEK